MLYYYGKFVIDIFPDRKNTELLHGKCSEVQFSNSGDSYESIFDDFKTHINNYLTNKPQMKKLTVEYKGYVLEVEINKEYSYIKGVCESISFENSGHISVTISPITALFIETVDLLTEIKDFEYKGYTLKLGVVETHKGGYCEELNYKTFGNDEEANITKFKKYINWKITSTKKEDKSHTHLLTQLDRLAKKDKENNFTPFELRGQLIGISHLFSKVLDITLEDIYKLYFERAEG